MFRDFKRGEYNLEISQVTNHRLISMILLITLAYSISTLSREFIKQKGIAKYVSRPTELKRFYRRHSSFSIGLHGQNWIESKRLSEKSNLLHQRPLNTPILGDFYPYSVTFRELN